MELLYSPDEAKTSFRNMYMYAVNCKSAYF